MPDNTGGPPSPDGERPESLENGAADEAFVAVVLDDAFIDAARIHEPTAEERMLYAALERAEAEAAEAASAADGEPQDGSHPEDTPEYWIDAAGEPVAFDDTPEEGHDDEGRFDSSDYTRYLPEGSDRLPREPVEPGESLLPEEGGCRHRGPEHPTGRGVDGGARQTRARDRAGGTPGRAAGSGRSRGRSVPGPRPAPEPLVGGRPGRWQRPVACVLAVVMGLSVVAFAVVTVQRAGSAQRAMPAQQPPGPPLAHPGAGRPVEGPTNGPTAAGAGGVVPPTSRPGPDAGEPPRAGGPS